jgi:preprotein translocase subunit Sec61beta
MGRVENYLKLVLWLQFLLRGMWHDLLRYYGLIILWSALLLAGTLAELASYAPPAATHLPSRWMLVPLCILALITGYLVGRVFGQGILIATGAIIGGVLVITPGAVHCIRSVGNFYSPELIPGLDPEPAVLTEDPLLFIKGAVGCAVLLLLMAGLLRYMHERARAAPRRALPRGAVICVLVVIAPIMLELIRVVVHLELPVAMPWEGWVATFLSEPGWPYALAITAWLSVSYLWVDYDCRLLPHLLHRAGVAWDGDHLAPNDAFLVDQLLESLPAAAGK